MNYFFFDVFESLAMFRSPCIWCMFLREVNLMPESMYQLVFNDPHTASMSCRGSVSSAIQGENLLKYCIMPRKVCRSFRFSGLGISVIALTFESMGLHPCVVYVSPKNSTCFCLYWILSKFNLMLFFLAVSSNCVNALSWSHSSSW